MLLDKEIEKKDICYTHIQIHNKIKKRYNSYSPYTCMSYGYSWHL